MHNNKNGNVCHQLEITKEPKILFLDIETSPNLAWVWGYYRQDVIAIEKPSIVLSFAYKWRDGNKVHCCILPDYSTEQELIAELWNLLDQADIVVGHNLDRFDIKKCNARFAAHNLRPPSPYQTIDTLKYARKYFAFPSNKLSELGSYLGVGTKLEHSGKQLWLDCMNDDPKAWGIIKRYNVQDIILLEKIYEKLRPYATNHPNLSWFTRERACPVCHSSEFIRSGFRYLKSGVKQRLTCKSCGHHFTPGSVIKHDSFSWWE
jgi:uncharacterized protein YprB with RNaseH-like and TPR domain